MNIGYAEITGLVESFLLLTSFFCIFGSVLGKLNPKVSSGVIWLFKILFSGLPLESGLNPVPAAFDYVSRVVLNVLFIAALYSVELGCFALVYAAAEDGCKANVAALFYCFWLI